MREHLPSLITRTSGLVRDIGPLLRHFAHSVGVGLVSLRSWRRISTRKASARGSITTRNRPRKACAPSTAQNVCKTGDPRQPDAPGSSRFPSEITGQPKNKNLLISIHIPKTGGTTFVEVLRKCAEEVFYLDYDYGWQPSPTALFRRGKQVTPPFESIIDEVGSLPGRSVIHGHFQAKKYVGRFPTAVYVTWLRDPIERVVSNYLYWQRTEIPGDHRRQQVTERNMNLEQFAQLQFARNLQQAFVYPLTVQRFDFIGITEEYDRSLELFRRLFCPAAQFDVTVRNENPNRLGKFYDLDPELRKKILQYNERDASIYLDGVRRFRDLCEQVGL